MATSLQRKNKSYGHIYIMDWYASLIWWGNKFTPFPVTKGYKITLEYDILDKT